MADRTNATSQRPASPAVLRPEQFLQHAHFEDCPPTDAAAPFVERVWSVTWELPPGVTYVSSVVPHPCLDLTVERGDGSRSDRSGPGVWLTGVWTRRFDVTLAGSGGAVGLKLHPGAFTALTGVAASDLTDQVVRAAPYLALPPGLAELPLSAHASREALCAVVASGVDVVSGVDGSADEDYALARVLAQAATDPSITRVDQLADVAHLSVRGLQRLTRRYIGVSPKWLIMRARVHDALEALHAAAADPNTAEPLDDLAARLGWFDQSHFTRDFRSIVGQSPAAYRDQLGPAPDRLHH